MSKIINSPLAPQAIGPYSQAVVVGGFIYVSGQLPINQVTGEFAGTDIATQTEQSLLNVQYILKEAGYDMTDVIKSEVFLKNMNDFGGMNEVYGRYFEAPYPARCAVEVARLPKDAAVEIAVVAYKA
ncbi:MAG: RidA family protein [Turicibacter sp.]